MDLSLIYNDPGHQVLAQRMGMDMQAYVANMDPRAVQANIANLSRGPRPNGPTMAQAYNGQRVGANSGNAFTSSSPTRAGMLSKPAQPPNPTENPQGVLSTSPVAPIQRGAVPAALTQPGQSDMLPDLKPAVLTSGGAAAAAPGALTEGTNTATANTAASSGGAPRPNSGASSGVRQTPTNNTGNARNSGMPDMRIGRMAQLGRIGTAMLGSAGDGLLASMAAGGDAMYDVNDENRAAEMAEYDNSERLRLEKAKLAALAARGGSGGKGGGLAAAASIKLRDVDAALQGLDDYDGVVGMGYWFNVGWDKITDSQRATIRQKIARVKVDATLANTALTKGAISDKEMAIFQSDQPAWTDGENAWRTWLTEYRGALMIMNSNLASGNYPYLEQGSSSTQSTGSAPAFNAADYTVEEISDPKG